MSKLPTRQIYLLLIIVMGIISLSVYSTYAIFTLESETSDIVNLFTPNSLEISTDVYEYKQVTVPKNSYITTDIDIYNAHEYELCYSVWYKPIGKDIDESKVSVYHNTQTTLEASGLIQSMNSKRITLIITNDNDSDVKVNIGLSSSKIENTCELNISKDKSLVVESVNNPEKISDIIIKNTGSNTNEEGYLTYKNQEEIIELNNNIYISKEFTYKSELFTLTEPLEVELKDILNYVSDEENSYYTCLEDKECKFLYKINKIEKETIKDEETEEKIDYYKITNIDRMFGYLKGNVGIKEITKNNITNYVYYGDNPNNYVYYNCTNQLDENTCELWRIIGTYYDEETDEYITKIIRNESIATSSYDEELNTWDGSIINKYLNDEYKLKTDKLVKELKYNQENIPNLDLNLDNLEIRTSESNSKIGLMSVTDYLNASICDNKKISEYDTACLNNNYLNLNNDLYEWTNTMKYLEEIVEVIPEEEIVENIEETTTETEEQTDEITNETTEEEKKETTTKITDNIIYSVGPNIQETNVDTKLNVRPVIYLKERTLLIGGTGTFEYPYKIR